MPAARTPMRTCPLSIWGGEISETVKFSTEPNSGQINAFMKVLRQRQHLLLNFLDLCALTYLLE